MAKVVVKSLKSKARKKPKSVTNKIIRDAEGNIRTVRTLNLQSDTFGRDFEYVFGRNVAEVRRRQKP